MHFRPLSHSVLLLGYLLPDVENVAHLKRELALIKPHHREDCAQEAYLAHLEGRDPLKAMKKLADHERWYARRHIQIETSEDGEPYAVDRDGTRQSFPAPQQSKSAATVTCRNSLSRKAG